MFSREDNLHLHISYNQEVHTIHPDTTVKVPAKILFQNLCQQSLTNHEFRALEYAYAIPYHSFGVNLTVLQIVVT